MRKPQIRRALQLTGPFKVSSLANGEFTIKPAWSHYGPKNCAPDINRYCKACDCYHIGGFDDRMALAVLIQEMLNKAGGHPTEDGR